MHSLHSKTFYEMRGRGNKWMKLTKRAVSPGKLFLVTWTFALIAAHLGSTERLYQIHGFRTVFTFEGLLWIGTATIIFFVGIATANRKYITLESDTHSNPDTDDYLWGWWNIRTGFLFISLFATLLILLLVYWTLTAIREVGSVSSFITLTYQEWSTVRRLWPAQKPFTGARLLYTTFISVVIFAATGLALVNRVETRSETALDSALPWLLLCSLGLVPLAILPLLVSQRLLIATALIGGIISYTVVSRKISLKIPIFGVLAGFIVWTAQELVRTGLTPDGIVGSVSHSLDRLLLYFTNNVGNINRVVASMPDYSYGFTTFGFIFDFLFLNEVIRTQYLSDFYVSLSLYKGGGPIPALAVPYVDFGIFGLIIIFVWGYVSQLLYLRSRQSLFAAQLYGLIAASILLSWHFALWSSVVFWTNVAILSVFALIIPKMRLWHYYNDRLTNAGDT